MNVEVRPISRKEAAEAVRCWHYLGDKGFRCQVAFGLFGNGELIGAAVYHGLSAPETAVGAFGLARNEQNGLWELGRLVLKPEANGHNYGSFFIWASLRQLAKMCPVRAIISYADSLFHYGAVYQASNFLYCGLTAQKSDYWVNGKIQERGKVGGGEWRPRSRKHRYVYVFDKTLELRWATQPYPKNNV